MRPSTRRASLCSNGYGYEVILLRPGAPGPGRVGRGGALGSKPGARDNSDLLQVCLGACVQMATAVATIVRFPCKVPFPSIEHVHYTHVATHTHTTPSNASKANKEKHSTESKARQSRQRERSHMFRHLGCIERGGTGCDVAGATREKDRARKRQKRLVQDIDLVLRDEAPGPGNGSESRHLCVGRIRILLYCFCFFSLTTHVGSSDA